MTVVVALADAGARLPALRSRLDGLADAGCQIVVVDDASTDDTGLQLRRWLDETVLDEAAHDLTVLTNAHNRGVAASRNRALAAATRDFVWFVDDDDDWPPDALEVFSRASMAADPNCDPDIVIGRAEYRHDAARPGRIIDGLAECRLIDRSTALGLMLDGHVHGFLWSKLIRRACLGVDPFPELSSQSDFVGLVRALDNASRVAIIPDVLYRYLRRPGSVTRVATPVLGNLLVAHDALLDVVAQDAHLAEDSDRIAYFTAWFYCAAVAFTPIRQGAPQPTRDEGMRRAREGLRGIRLGPVTRRRASLGLSLWAIRHAGRLYPVTIRVLLSVKDTARALRTGTA